ncbi:MAG: UPF0280 family protein [Deltaproteobacteria bacterium]|nr:UPF0280 family protein [Deltaproteobacteria bacterium]
MPPYEERFYRRKVNAGDLVSFHVAVKETDLWVSADLNLEKETRDLIFACRQQLETYIRMHPKFSISLMPWPEDPFAPPIVKKMIDATRGLGVGPMASVAGAIAQHIAEGLLRFTDQVIVENGGDIFLRTNRSATVSIFAGSSPLSEKFGLTIPERLMPLGVCSSSAKVGHSLSMGIADVCCLLSPSAVLADAAATSFGNKIKRKEDLETVAEWATQIEGIIGYVFIVEDSMAVWGDIELVNL